MPEGRCAGCDATLRKARELLFEASALLAFVGANNHASGEEVIFAWHDVEAAVDRIDKVVPK